MCKEMDILRNKIKFQRKLADYWEGRWKQEYTEKIELLRKKVEQEKKYEGNSQAGHAVTSRVTCRYCGKPNHMENECWKKSRKCLYCVSAKHQISSCPSASKK